MTRTGIADSLKSRSCRLLAVIAVAMFVACVLTDQGVASADVRHPAETPVRQIAPTAVVTGFHQCQNFGNSVDNYRAGYCVDYDFYTAPDGVSAIRFRAQVFCQNSTTKAIVQCAGIYDRMQFGDFNTQKETENSVFQCGREDGTLQQPCPRGRFEHSSHGLPYVCNHIYSSDSAYTDPWPVIVELNLPASGHIESLVKRDLTDRFYPASC